MSGPYISDEEEKQLNNWYVSGGSTGEGYPYWLNAIVIADLLHIPPWQVEDACENHPEWVARVVADRTAKQNAERVLHSRAQRTKRGG